MILELLYFSLSVIGKRRASCKRVRFYYHIDAVKYVSARFTVSLFRYQDPNAGDRKMIANSSPLSINEQLQDDGELISSLLGIE